ncbi:NAD(P)/FAD-dependent oxidoreductase [Mycolicibacterium sp. CBMA 234]|uniref:protoporphyrinogen/coproporphyrinogen oxidase n=1 Tax=Mycolicibacterium sp. CBMA 234 TaxID=1918495 RepID=UPI00139083E7|nr:NAD(P)/FAD-dependent oxidoreductase [Mycolicibacterium sp. CBMA 234]
MAQQSAVVVGAGVAGTSAAYDLATAGYRVTVLEANDRVGGRLWSVRKGDYLMDLGAAFYLGTYKDTIAMVHEVGLTPYFDSRPAMGAVKREGTMHWLDYTKPIRTGLTTKLLSWKAKLQARKLSWLIFKHRNDLGYDSYESLAALDTETVGSYCRRELSEEFLNYAGRPLISGAWVQDDTKCSLALMVWTARNLLVPEVYNLTGGVAQLPTTLVADLDVKLSSPVSNVTDTATGATVTYRDGADGEEVTQTFDACVIATETNNALAIYPGMDRNAQEFLAMVDYRRLGSVAIGLAKRPPGDRETYTLGVLYEDPDVIAIMADHNKAKGRCPDDKGLLTVLLTHEYLNSHEHLTDEEVTEYAIRKASEYYGDIAPNVEETACVRWHASVPAMNHGRFKRMAQYHRDMDRSSRIQLAGDFDRIPGLNGALMSGRDAARRIQAAVPLTQGSR